jgi:hypothetical protein
MMNTKLFIRQPAVIVLAIYLLLSLLCFVRWTHGNWFPITGDEPHYLIMTSGIIHDGTLEQTTPYAREFAAREIYPGILAPAGATPTPSNTHAIESKNGLFNVHNIGLPLVLALPFLIGGVAGAKLFLVIASSALAILAWKLTAYAGISARQRASAVIAATCGLPFLPAASQVYPDLLAGIIALTALWWIRERRVDIPPTTDAMIAIAVAILPWLQIKFSAVACIACTGLTICAFLQSRQPLRSSVFVLMLAISFAGLAAYNLYAFDNAAGPYGNNALVANTTALMVFLGLHFDQFQGLFVQNPALLAGALFLIPYIKTHRLQAATACLMYLAIVAPNAMHPNWYGGFSFAGRFAWTGAAILLPAVLFGLTRLAQAANGRGLYFVYTLILLNSYLYVKYTVHRFDFYNSPKAAYWPESVQSLYPALKAHLPALQDASWAFSYFPNQIALLAFTGLVVAGAISAYVNPRIFIRALSAFLIFCGVLFAVAPTLTSPDRPPLFFPGFTLPTNMSRQEGGSMIASGPTPGYATFGPNLPLASGTYQFTFDYSAFYSGQPSIGTWDVAIPSAGRVLKSGEIAPAIIHGKIEDTFEIDHTSANQGIEIRTYYPGNNAGILAVHSLTLKHLDTDGEAEGQK